MDGLLLKYIIQKNGDTQKTLADAMGMKLSSLCCRISGKIDFRRNEMDIIRKRYNLSQEEFNQIFFSDIVTK